MKGNWESSEIFAASAVFPLLGGPEGDDQSPIRCFYNTNSLAKLSGCSKSQQIFLTHVAVFISGSSGGFLSV